MKKFYNLILFCTLFVGGVGAQNLELKDITSGQYTPKGVGASVSAADGESFFKANDDRTMIVKYSYKTGVATDTIFNIKHARECSISNFQGFLISPDEKRVLVYTDAEAIYRRGFKAMYYYYDVRRNLIRKLTDNKAKQQVPTFSRDGRMLAYVCDNNIWLAKFDYDTESQITTDGRIGEIINGTTDWVYEEEFETVNLMDFSSDNKLLAFVKFDESAIPEYKYQEFGQQLYPSTVTVKYPKAGEKNSIVTCNVYDIESKTTRKMDVPTEKTEYIPRIAFLPNDGQLAVMTLNRNQNNFDMYFANPRSAVCRLILHEENTRYVDSELLHSLHFFGDQFVYLSEKEGYKQLYLYGNSGALQKKLTPANFDVTDVLAVNPETKLLYFESAEEGPERRTISKVDLVKGTITRLSSKVGYNSAQFSANGKYYINSWSNLTTPPVITVNDANGKTLRVLEDNKTLNQKLQSIQMPKKEFITVKTESGVDLNAWILKPSNFDPSHQYPLVMVQYSGPDSQQVLDRFGFDWYDYLVQQGFIVACVDGRGTGCRGEEFKKCTYLNLSVKESDDQIQSAHYLGSLPYIDKNRIAIWGWSFGGEMVLMSMSRGKGTFKAGVSIAPVTDWRFYDSVYTERFMKTPEENADGYKKSSPINLADQLQGHLLLVHASADDNVHIQNTLEYTNALIKANKQFDFFVFPDLDHSIKGVNNRTYLYTKVINFLKTNL